MDSLPKKFKYLFTQNPLARWDFEGQIRRPHTLLISLSLTFRSGACPGTPIPGGNLSLSRASQRDTLAGHVPELPLRGLSRCNAGGLSREGDGAGFRGGLIYYESPLF
jgi:hypothetical protein